MEYRLSYNFSIRGLTPVDGTFDRVPHGFSEHVSIRRRFLGRQLFCGSQIALRCWNHYFARNCSGFTVEFTTNIRHGQLYCMRERILVGKLEASSRGIIVPDCGTTGKAANSARTERRQKRTSIQGGHGLFKLLTG